MKILVVTDMQNDFINGTLGTKEAVEIVDSAKDKIESYLAAGDTVIYTQDTHAEAYFQTQEGQKLPLAGLTKGQGRELLKVINAPEQLYLKTPTADLLDNKPQQADETELGIEYNVLDQYLLGNEVNPGVKANIENRFEITKHKRELPVTPFDTWWK